MAYEFENMTENEFYSEQLPLRAIILLLLQKITLVDDINTQLHLCRLLRNIFFPSLRDKLLKRFQKYFEERRKEIEKEYEWMDDDENKINYLYVFGSINWDALELAKKRELTEAEIECTLQAAIEIMEEAKLIEVPHIETPPAQLELRGDEIEIA